MKKKHLLFVIDSLGVGGAEKSLLTFLSVLDYSRFDVDLQLFGYGGILEQYLPKEVKLLPPLTLTRRLQRYPFYLLYNTTLLWSRIRFSVSIKKKGLRPQDITRLFWKNFSNHIDFTKEYDVSIAYGQNLPSVYVSQRTLAKKKLAWVNGEYAPTGFNFSFYKSCYQQIDNIVTVSQSANIKLLETYPDFQPKTTVIMDMVDGRVIEQMSMAECGIKIEKDVPFLLTMARLNKPQKGYDMALETCRILKERGVNFRWYALGEGPYRSEMEQYIKEHKLEDTFILLGALPNPYPILRQCTLYVQTSRHEGFGLSIAEARILNKPVVTTEFDAVYAQMVPGENGLVVPQDPVAVADAVERLLSDADLYQHIVGYLKQEKKGNTEEIEKFYNLLQE